MARIEGVHRSDAGLIVSLAYRFGPAHDEKLTGRPPHRGNGIEPMEIWAHQPKMMMGMGKFNQVIRKGKTVDAGLALIGAGLAIAALRQIASVGGRALVAIPSAPLGSRQAR